MTDGGTMINKHNYRLGMGLTSLLLSIPAPTLIHENFTDLIAKDSISLLNIDFHGFEAQMLLILMIVTGIALFSTSIYVLGGYLVKLGDHNSRFIE